MKRKKISSLTLAQKSNYFLKAEVWQLIESFQGNNTEENKKYVFDKIMQNIFLSYVNDNFDFYKAVSQGDQKNFVTDILYQNFKGDSN